jgi:hypothetical protein
MTAATPGPSGPNIFSMFSSESGLYRTKREAFVFSLAGQAAILGLLIYFATSGVGTPITISDFRIIKELPLIYSGHNGGGGGNHDPLPASVGNLRWNSLRRQRSCTLPPCPTFPCHSPSMSLRNSSSRKADRLAILYPNSRYCPTAPVARLELVLDVAVE